MTKSKLFEIVKTHRNFLILIIIVFLLYRVLCFFIYDIRFNAGTLEVYWQFADPVLLQNDLFRSLFYFHSQPPLFNLFIGVILKLFPIHHINYHVFFLLYFSLGLIFALSLFLTMASLNVHVVLNLILTIIFISKPSTILYENWLMYTYPVSVLLCLSVFFLHRYSIEEKGIYGVIFLS